MTEMVFVEGRNPKTAARLLAKAREQGIPVSEVRTTQRGYNVPASLLDGGKAKTAPEPVPVEHSTPEPEQFDPSNHDVSQVVEYLATADASEQERVLAAERSGKARKTLLSTDSEGEK